MRAASRPLGQVDDRQLAHPEPTLVCRLPPRATIGTEHRVVPDFRIDCRARLTARIAQIMQHERRHTRPTNGASGYVCPRCGGALREHGDRASLSFECRIGDRYSEAEMWIAHSVARNQALL